MKQLKKNCIYAAEDHCSVYPDWGCAGCILFLSKTNEEDQHDKKHNVYMRKKTS